MEMKQKKTLIKKEKKIIHLEYPKDSHRTYPNDIKKTITHEIYQCNKTKAKKTKTIYGGLGWQLVISSE